MGLQILLKGSLIGFSIAAPVGPIGLLCIQRTLAQGWACGLASGLGAATADGIYGCVAGFGLTFLSGFLVDQQTWLALVGGLFLCFLGLKTLLSRPAERAASTRGRAGAYLSTFALTLTNPVTILSFTAVFAGLGMPGGSRDYLSAGLLVLGVFLGSALWWLTLSGGVALFRSKIHSGVVLWVNRISGVIITLLGLLALFGVGR